MVIIPANHQGIDTQDKIYYTFIPVVHDNLICVL